MNQLDDIDIHILQELQQDGRLTNAEIARRVNLSPPAVHTRIRHLEETGIIQQYTALLNAEQVGYDLMCLVSISLQTHQFELIEQFREVIRRKPEVLECYHITGEFDYILKVAIKNRKDLERFVVEELTPLEGISKIYTSIVLTQVKYQTALPLKARMKDEG